MPAKNLDIGSYALIRAMPFAAVRVKMKGTKYDPEMTTEGKIIRSCYASFKNFLPYWKFSNRENGDISSFEDPWSGQKQFIDAMDTHPWIFALKAGKLGFSELECAYDGWSLLFRTPRTRVHIFSKDAESAKGFLQIVKFGLTHLPPWMRPSFVTKEAGGETTESLILTVPWTIVEDPDDKRTLKSFATSENVAIDQSAMHSHVDELSHWKADPKTAWQAIQSTVSPQIGTCHIVTRGAGPKVYTATLWAGAKKKESKLFPLFVPFDQRPDRMDNPEAWRRGEESNFTVQGLSHFAPMTEEDALAGDETAVYIPVPVWNGLKEKYWDRDRDPDDPLGVAGKLIPVLRPGDRTPLILSLDAGMSSDMFAAVMTSRDPRAPKERVAVRKVDVWIPGENASGRVDFEGVERTLRMYCLGGCAANHPLGNWRSEDRRDCPFCPAAEKKDGPGYIPKYNIICIVYDPYQLEDMMQRFTTDGVAYCDPFNQGTQRLVADRDLYNMALNGMITHYGDQYLDDSIANARAKLQKDEESKMRIIKKADHLKIDPLVAFSMGAYQCMFMNMPT